MRDDLKELLLARRGVDDRIHALALEMVADRLHGFETEHGVRSVGSLSRSGLDLRAKDLRGVELRQEFVRFREQLQSEILGVVRYVDSRQAFKVRSSDRASVLAAEAMGARIAQRERYDLGDDWASWVVLDQEEGSELHAATFMTKADGARAFCSARLALSPSSRQVEREIDPEAQGPRHDG